MKALKTDLITQKYTQIFHEENFTNNAPHNFVVVGPDNLKVGDITFQEGPIKETGVNGVMNEDLIAMVIKRLSCFQDSPFKCQENGDAITHLEDALKVLRSRTTKREARGVEGTHTI